MAEVEVRVGPPEIKTEEEATIATKNETTTTNEGGARLKTTALLASEHRFSNETKKLSEDFKAMLEETEADGWKFLSRSKDVDVYQKPSTTSPMGILKGVGIIEGYTPREVFPVSQLPGCRQIWDSLFESGKGVEVLDKVTVLSYASTKPQGMVSSRDMCVLVLNEFVDDGTVYSMSRSVVDPTVPAVKGKVRANMVIMGWLLQPITNSTGEITGTKATYILELDLAGWIPGNILKVASAKIPLVIADIRKYITRHYPIAFPILLGGAASKTPEFSHDTSRLDLEYEIDNRVASYSEFLIHKKRYPNGITATITPDTLQFEVNEKGNLIIKHTEEQNGLKVHVIIEKNRSGNHITVNGKKLLDLSTTTTSSSTNDLQTPSQSQSSFIEMTPEQDLLEETKRKLEELENLIRNPPGRNDETMGLIILAATPVVAFILAKLFG